MIRCVIFEDEHLLVVNKPAGMNTHAPSPFAGEGIYEWLKNREPRWSQLAIIHRLDKETSGVMVFGKTTTANRSLTEQFTAHTIRKKYRLLTDRLVKFKERTIISSLVRVGDKYSNRPLHAGGERAETHFHLLEAQTRSADKFQKADKCFMLEAQPVTGRTHQIRVHAAAEGFPILGDTMYGGAAAARVYLHAAELTLKHPVSGVEMKFNAPENFEANARLVLREALLENSPADTDAYRLIHGTADGWPDWYVERLGEFLLSHAEQPLSATQLEQLENLAATYNARGAYHKILNRQVRRSTVPQASPQLILGERAADQFIIHENSARFELSFNEGYSVGLFLDQRENRRRLLTNHMPGEFALFPKGATGAEVLNTFAYTCGFSVCAAKAGAHTTSLDLSKKYLAWGRRNFNLNALDPAAHEFIYGDVFDWLRRLAKKGRTYDLILLDPPTYSQSKSAGAFSAERDYGRVVVAALPALKPGGVLFVSTNAARWEPEEFMVTVEAAINSTGRKIMRQHYVPQPPDFPVHREEPAYLKTAWLRVE